MSLNRLTCTLAAAAITALFIAQHDAHKPAKQAQHRADSHAAEVARIEAQVQFLQRDREERASLSAQLRAKADADNVANKEQWDAQGLPNPYNTGGRK